MKTTLPRPIKPNSGLTRIGRRWYAVVTQDGVARKVALGTDDVSRARSLRDELFASLLDEGAEWAVSGKRARAFKPDTKQYIYYRKPWTVVVKGRRIGEFETEQEAREARNKHVYETQTR